MVRVTVVEMVFGVKVYEVMSEIVIFVEMFSVVRMWGTEGNRARPRKEGIGGGEDLFRPSPEISSFGW